MRVFSRFHILSIKLVSIFAFCFSCTAVGAGPTSQIIYQCGFHSVCLEANACSKRDLPVRVLLADGAGIIITPGQEFKVESYRLDGYEALTVVSFPVEGSTAFLTIFDNDSARLTFHFHRPQPTAMTNFGSCEKYDGE